MSNKNYIGKGKAQKFGVRMNISMSKAEQFIYEKDGERYLTFFINEMQNPDDYGRTHTAYVLSKDESEPEPAQELPAAAEPETPIKKSNRKK